MAYSLEKPLGSFMQRVEQQLLQQNTQLQQQNTLLFSEHISKQGTNLQEQITKQSSNLEKQLSQHESNMKYREACCLVALVHVVKSDETDAAIVVAHFTPHVSFTL